MDSHWPVGPLATLVGQDKKTKKMFLKERELYDEGGPMESQLGLGERQKRLPDGAECTKGVNNSALPSTHLRKEKIYIYGVSFV